MRDSQFCDFFCAFVKWSLVRPAVLHPGCFCFQASGNIPHPLQTSFFPSSFSLHTCAFWMFLLMATSPYFMEALLFSPLKNKKMHLFDTDSLSVQSHSFSVLASIFCWRFPTVSSCPLFGMPVPLKPPQEFPLHFLVTDAATEERVSVLLMRVSCSAVVARSLFLALARESFLGHLSPIA